MTYCVAIKLNQGIVFASDSRTNAGVDYIRTSSKMFQFVWPSDRVITLLTSGNLATTQAVVNAIQRDLDNPKAKFSLLKAEHLFDVAGYIGVLSQAEQAVHEKAVEKTGGTAAASFLLGGQIGGRAHEVFMIYPEGNYISASPDTPFLQIGESKYGKPILDRIISPATSLDDAARCALVSLDSTMRSNISVGPPVDLALYQAGSLQAPLQVRYDLNSSLYKALQKSWNDGLRRAFDRLPRFEWETR